jgi:Ca-activated chloride channel family protein
MYRIEHIDYLVGLAGLPMLIAALFLLLGWKRRTVTRIGDAALVRQLINTFSPTRFLIKAGLALAAFMIIVLGAANFQKQGSMQNVQRKGLDVMFVLDVSKSMLARDVKPSRLEKAKQLLLQLNDKLDNDRIGLVLFAGRAYMQMPLTSDHGAARMYIQNASPDAVPTQGTVFADALRMANMAFNSKERKYKAIVLVSDGEDHDPDALKVAKELAQDGVMINTIGIGSPEGSPIVDPATGELKKDENGNTVISKLNEPELQQLAYTTNGDYVRLDNVDDALITITQQLDNAGQKSMSDAEFIDYISYFQWFIGAALVLLLVELLFSERRKAADNGRESRKQGAVGGRVAGSALATRAILLAVAGVATLSVNAQNTQNTNAQIRSGNRYYKKNQIDRSLQQYESAVRQSPNDPTANYNLGNAQYRKNSYDLAGKSYDAAVTHSQDKTMQEQGYYNEGVAMVRQKKLMESIDAWKKALKLNAGDSAARDNLEKALTELKRQQQQQKDQNNQQKDQKDQKDKKDQKKDQNQQQQEQQQPKPQPSRLNKQQVEQLLKALEQKERDLQNKMQQNKVRTPNQPDKDW